MKRSVEFDLTDRQEAGLADAVKRGKAKAPEDILRAAGIDRANEFVDALDASVRQERRAAFDAMPDEHAEVLTDIAIKLAKLGEKDQFVILAKLQDVNDAADAAAT